jgi:hypothetical protein
MTPATHELVGREVYSRDGVKLGKIAEVVHDGEYAVIRRSLFGKLIAPITAIESAGDRLTLPRTSSYLDNAPKVDPKHDLSATDRARLDEFFTPKAA